MNAAIGQAIYLRRQWVTVLCDRVRDLARCATFLLIALAGGCASVKTEVNSFVDPDFAGRTYERILISPRYDDLGLRSATEANFGQALTTTHASAVPSMELLLPTREWKDEEIFPLMSERNIDAVLLVTQTGAYQDREFIPERIDVDTDQYLTARAFRPYRGWRNGQVRTRTRVTRSGGYYVDLPRIRHEIRLYDVSSRRMAWYATTLTAGDSSASEQQMIQSLARETVARLVTDGLVRSTKPDEND